MSEIRAYLLITFGLLIYTFAVTAFLAPHRMVGGGVTGISTIIYFLSGEVIPIGYSYFVINFLLVAIAIKILGPRFGFKTIYAIFMSSFLLSVFQNLIHEPLLEDKFMCAVISGIMCGAGIGISLVNGGSTAGTDIVAMIINKYRTISYGKIVIYSDFVIIGSSMLVGFHIDTVIYGYVMTAVFGYTVDMIMAGNQQSSQVFIVTHDYEKMAQAIVDNIHRGVTLIDSQGWYTKKESKIVMVVCRKRETTMILKFVKTIDPEAFMTVGSVMGVYGKGFQAISKP